MLEEESTLMKLLIQATEDSVITCPRCFRHLEPDVEKCPCGWRNLLRQKGFI